MPFLLNREVSGVTGACVAIRRDTFEHVGGFSVDFPLNYNDVDLCFKLTLAGYRIIWTPDAQLFHFESMTREIEVVKDELDRLIRFWGRHMLRDPFLPFARHSMQSEETKRKKNRLITAAGRSRGTNR